MQFLLLKADKYLLLMNPGREMGILVWVFGKLLLQTLIHCSQWSLRLCKAKQLFYGVSASVVFRTFLSSIFLGKVIISLSACELHQKLNVTCWS